MLAGSEFPARYEPLRRLGKGGGGEVWAARDRVTDAVVALKLLREQSDEAEMLALVREATALSGIEGIGVPRVLHFGRLPSSERAYMVRELVEGHSLADLLPREPGDNGAPSSVGPRLPAVDCLAAVAQAADLLTRLHRALLLHGDIKPANIIVGEGGKATLVDLGLAAHWHEGGARPEGLTPRYAAPELFRGDALTPRAEVFALGATAGEVMRAVGDQLDAERREGVAQVVQRATAERPAQRYPSADEFAEALRRAARLDSERLDADATVWSIVGIDAVCADLLDRISALPGGGGLLVSGPEGSGRTTVLRRVSWSLGVAGAAVAHIEASSDLETAISVVTQGRLPADLVLLVDDADQRPEAELRRLDEQRQAGSRLVMVVSSQAGAQSLPGRTFALYPVPPLADDVAAGLVRRMIPSLSDTLVDHVVARTGGLPGTMRALLGRLEGRAVVSIADIDRCLAEVPGQKPLGLPPPEIHRLLDRGRFDTAAEALEDYRGDTSIEIAVARAKLATGRGAPREAIEELERVRAEVVGQESGDLAAAWHLQLARAKLRSGDYGDAQVHSNLALTRLGVSLLGDLASGRVRPGGSGALGTSVGAMVADALAVSGLTQSYAARHDDAARTLRRSVEVARASGESRMLAVALGSLAFALQRDDKLEEAEAAHVEALELAEQAGDAGSIATTRLNLSGIAKLKGDIAAALTHLEAAADMGRRSGRQTTVRQALLNLANLNLHLGRHAKARASIDALAADRDKLELGAQAQLLALEAELAALSGQVEQASRACLECALAYEQLGRPVDAAEALLENVLQLARSHAAEPAALSSELERAERLLSESGAHRALLALAHAQVAALAGREEEARAAFDEAIRAGQASGHREWVWRSLDGRSRLRAAAGDAGGAADDRATALSVLEQMALELPRDLREVYWNDPRRRALRHDRVAEQPPATTVRPGGAAPAASVDAPTELASLLQGEHAGGGRPAAGTMLAAAADDSEESGPVSAPKDKLWRVLEVNREIAGEHDLDRLLERVTDHALALLDAERGFVLLRSKSGDDRLSVHAARDRDGTDPHARFSQSIAERVVDTGEPFVALDAGSDDRVADYVSVHQLMLKSVACVPIRARSPRVIGALYLETRVRSAARFRRELPILGALADQVAIAIETARLVSENLKRAQELELANVELEAARDKLEQLLGRRTEQLASTRRDLRSARAVLRGHFGYKGIVGKSSAMRRVYAVIERVKDADVPLLLTGESGTGKEVIARAIHKGSPRGKQRFVGINCGAIPEHLLESELFGHVRGAFTGADRDNKGLFRELSEGTILLDEIGEMPQKMQAGLLRVLQEKTVRPVGGTREEPVNTRVIAATHRKLADMVAAGTFREDLFYRLNVIELRVPPLRERLEDVPLLIDHFLRLYAARYNRDKRMVSREALKLLMSYHWPGNVRQLENVLLNAWILSDSAELLPEDFELPEDRPPPARAPATVAAAGRATSLDERKHHEKERIIEALTSCNWNRAKAAELIEMPRRTFYRRLKKYGIQ